MHDPKVVVQRGLGDHEIGKSHTVPHAVMVGKVTLQGLGTFQEISRGLRLMKPAIQLLHQKVVVARRPSRVQLLQPADWTDPQLARKFTKGSGDGWLIDPRGHCRLTARLSPRRSGQGVRSLRISCQAGASRSAAAAPSSP